MKNISEYTIPRRYSKWHCFTDGFASFVIVAIIAFIIMTVILIATIMIWA